MVKSSDILCDKSLGNYGDIIEHFSEIILICLMPSIFISITFDSIRLFSHIKTLHNTCTKRSIYYSPKPKLLARFLHVPVKILCIGTDRSQQTVQTKIRLLLKKQSDQDLHCLPFFLHLLEALLQCKIKLFYIKDNYGSWSGCPNI